MKGLSLALLFHGWRSPATVSDLFMRFYTCGFVTVGASRWLLDDMLAAMKEHLRALAARDAQP